MKLDELADLMNVSTGELLEALREQIQRQNGVDFITGRSEDPFLQPPGEVPIQDESRTEQRESPRHRKNSQNKKNRPQSPTETVQKFLPDDVVFWIGVALTIHRADWSQVAEKSEFELRELGSRFVLNIVKAIRRKVQYYSRILLEILDPFPPQKPKTY